MSGNPRIVQALGRIPMFAHLEPAELDALSSVLKPRVVPAESLIFEEGRAAKECLVILRGRAIVWRSMPRGREKQMGILEVGSPVGHLGLIDGKPYAATYRAGVDPVIAVTLGRDDFDRLYRSGSRFTYKIMDWLVADLAQRLRAATTILRDASLVAEAKRREGKADELARVLTVTQPGLSFDDYDLDAVDFATSDWADLRRKPR